MRNTLVFLRKTLFGGLTFLVPIVLIVWILQKAIVLVGKLAQPALNLLPASLTGGIFIGALETSIGLLIIAFIAGLVVRTRFGQRILAWLENGIIGSLPQFNFVRGIAESAGHPDDCEIEVVLVPADAGWALGFIFEPGKGATEAVFLPGAPQWTSGSVVFAARDVIRPAGISFAEAVMVLRKLGSGSTKVAKALEKDDAAA